MRRLGQAKTPFQDLGMVATSSDFFSFRSIVEIVSGNKPGRKGQHMLSNYRVNIPISSVHSLCQALDFANLSCTFLLTQKSFLD